MTTTAERVMLHVGCGRMTRAQTTPGFAQPGWREIRVDIDPAHQPDLVADITDLSALPDGSADAVFSSHNLEHLEAHQVGPALAEWRRVLAPGGFAVITCPDLQAVCAMVARDQLTQPIYQARSGPISALDILYGHRPALAAGNTHMAHRCGFTESLLAASLRRAGFASVVTARREAQVELWALAAVGVLAREDVITLWRQYCAPAKLLHIADAGVDVIPAIGGEA